ncbi:MAG TPA: carboxylating nicotinate-nucleotide diphosphorylase [Candidatus Atribacteria bacterium]|nr:carboxylating nicotinate-nucleotide diphosphorylase [Candidatus Atribacteria bacterium]
MLGLVPWDVDRRLQAFLEEDLGFADITTQGLGDLGKNTVKAKVTAKKEGVMAGGYFALRVFTLLNSQTRGKAKVFEGQNFPPGEVLLEIEGPARAILMGERTALNLLQRLCGIATKTQELVKLVEGLPVKVADTRKTSPGLRIFEKYAVRCGGGVNHRLGLYDCALIKDNHIALCGSVKEAIKKIRPALPFTAKIVVECTTLAQVQEALEEKADIIMLDNMSVENIREAVKIAKGKATLEASGDINPTTIRKVAEQGVDIISTGYITHHATWIDMSLKMEENA